MDTTTQFYDYLKPYLSDLLSSEKGVPIRRSSQKIGRNKLCPCGSKKKYKKCCFKISEKKGNK